MATTAPGRRGRARPRQLVRRRIHQMPNADRLFEPFQRMRRVADHHHGLGLSIVRAIAVAHGAALTAHARPGGGLTVEIRFPAMS